MGWGWFLGSGLGVLLWARVMCWKRERDDEVERDGGQQGFWVEGW